MTKVTVTQIRKYMANLNRMAVQFQGTNPSSEDVTITLKDAAQAYDKATVCLQAIRALQNGNTETCVSLLMTTGFQFQTKTLANSYLDGAKLENFAGMAKHGVKFREYRNLKTARPKQTASLSGPARPSNRASQILDTSTLIARASHLINAETDTERKAAIARNKAEKLLNIAQAKDISETIARANLAPTYLGDGSETSQGSIKRPAPYKR